MSQENNKRQLVTVKKDSFIIAAYEDAYGMLRPNLVIDTNSATECWTLQSTLSFYTE
jgi:hypothetical protein